MMRVFLLALAMAGAAAAQYTIAGQVVNGVTGEPLARTRLFLRPSGETADPLVAVADGEGRFRFEGLARGKYGLEAQRLGFVGQMWGQKGLGRAFASAIAVGPDQETSDIRFPLIPGGVITGKVTDEAGDAARQVLVQPIRINQRATGTHAQRFQGVWTNDRGEYRIHSLPAGEWVVAASGRPWYARHLVQQPVFVTSYHPGTADAAAAQPIQLSPGQTARADIRVATGEMTTVTVDLEPLGLAAPSVYLLQAGPEGILLPMPASSISTTPKSVRTGALAPGRYVLLVSADRMGTAARLEFTANGGEQRYVIESKPAAVRGRAEIRGPRAGVRGELFVLLRDPLSGFNSVGAIAPDGSFRLPAVAPGRYQLVIGGTGDVHVRELAVEGAMFEKGFVEIAAGGEVVVKAVLDTVTFPVPGVVTQAGRGVVGAFAVLVPAEAPDSVMRMRMDQTDSDGTFLWRNLAPGEYLAFATLEGEEHDFADHEVRAKHLEGAVRLKIGPEMETPVRLNLEDGKKGAAAERQE